MKPGRWDVELMLAEVSPPFSRAGWLFEIKYDGFRMLAGRDRGRPRLRYRGGSDGTASFPEIAAALEALPERDIVLDGEVVVLDPSGRPAFQRLQQRFQARRGETQAAAARHPASFFAIDVLFAGDRDLRPLPLVERKAILRGLVTDDGALRYVDHVESTGESFFDEVRGLGLEGIVGKRADAPYAGGRSRDWRKIRAERAESFVVVGFTQAALGEEGGLHLAHDGEDGLVYAGRVGSGFESGVLAEVRALLEPLRRATPACGGAVPRGRGHVWVEPRLRCEVRYKEMTDAGLLRHPVFVRFRH